MGLKVTAEGIEDEFQAKFLRLAGCELLQGFRSNRPMTAARFAPANEFARHSASEENAE